MLSASLSALRLLTSDLTAIVTVADDGGSSGRLREEYGVARVVSRTKSNYSAPADKHIVDEIKQWDAVVSGLGD